jgi:hypothetical protein
LGASSGMIAGREREKNGARSVTNGTANIQ